MSNPTRYIPQVGDVLKIVQRHEKRPKFWKITAPKYPWSSYEKGSYSYPVILCSPTGKEFKDRNGFMADFIETSERVELVCNCPVGTKADIQQGIKEGARKRRIQWITAKIASLTKELDTLTNCN